MRQVLFALLVVGVVGGRVEAAGQNRGAADLARDQRLRERLSSGVLRWGGDAEGGAPFQLRDPQDPRRIIGYEVELADALADVLSRRLGIPLVAQFQQYQWESLELGLSPKKDFDCIISGYEITPDRRAIMRFTRPYYIYKQQLVVRRDDDRIASLDDCRDKAVGTLNNSAAHRILQALPIGRITGFEGQVEPYLDLELGRLDAVLLDAPIALYYASTNPKLKYAGEPIGRGEYGIALRPDDQDLAAALDEALAELMRDGRLQRIYRKWRLWNPDQAALAAGPENAAELRGLGFDDQGHPLPVPATDSPEVDDAVDINIIAASAQHWTIGQYAPLLLAGAAMTVFLTLGGMALAVTLALPICLCRLYGPAPVRWLALVYVEFFRGIPMLLVLFVLYFGLSSIGIQMDPVLTAIVGFGMNYAAYEAEIYRSAILSVPTGQWEAARALGMSESLTFRRIILPQALRTALGPMTNDFVAMFKDTSLVSVIAVHELTKEYLILARSSLKFLELGLLTAVLYLCMSVPLGHLSRYLEGRWKSPR
jgi:His/Glu/Gln/Arg/opine family amino acid ABC transporter permease subunit